MHRDVSDIALNLLRHIHNSFGVGIAFIKLFEIRVLFHRAFQCHRESLRAYGYEFGNLIAQGIGKTESSGNIAHSSASHHSAESSYLPHGLRRISLWHTRSIRPVCYPQYRGLCLVVMVGLDLRSVQMAADILKGLYW